MLVALRTSLCTVQCPVTSRRCSHTGPGAATARGGSVNPARLLVLLFSTLLVWSGAQFFTDHLGKLATIPFFLPLVIMVLRYLELSVSVMIGVPSIALAAPPLFCGILASELANWWLILSGAALAFIHAHKAIHRFGADLLIGIPLPPISIESRQVIHENASASLL